VLWLTRAAASPPSPGAPHVVGSGDGSGAPTPLKGADKTATDAAGLIGEHWSQWLSAGLRILLILGIAILLRYLIRRSITKLIDRMNRRSEVADSGNALRGLLVSGERRRQRSAAIASVLRSFASIVIMGTAMLMVLSGLGINLAPLLASAGVAGVALGFGARNLVQDVLAGMFMLLEDQYGVGDRVDVGEAQGTVLEVGLRITQLRGDGGEVWYIRNGEIKRVGNLSQGWATAVLDVQLHPGEDLDAVRSAIATASEELASSSPWDELLWEPVDVLGLDSVTLDLMVVRVAAKTMPGKAASVERELRWRIKRALDARGIESVEREPAAEEEPSAFGGGPAGAEAGAEAAAERATTEQTTAGQAAAEQAAAEQAAAGQTRRPAVNGGRPGTVSDGTVSDGTAQGGGRRHGGESGSGDKPLQKTPK
jgi:small-conductance mechanosensitive channel